MLIKFCSWNALSFSLVTHTEVMHVHPISTLLDRIVHVCITTAYARRSGWSAKLEINKPSTSKLVRSLDEKLTVCLSPILHSALIFAHAQFYLRGCLFMVWLVCLEPVIRYDNIINDIITVPVYRPMGVLYHNADHPEQYCAWILFLHSII